MSTFLKNIKELGKKGAIDKEQSLYLIFLEAGMDIQITAPKLLALTKAKYIESGKIAKSLYKELEDIKLKGTIEPLYTTDVSKEVVKKICTYVCVKENGILRVPGGDEDPVGFTSEEYLGGEMAIAYHYLIMLFLFPTEGDANRRWIKHFLGAPYTGVPLRKRSKSSGKAFKTLAKKRDMGAFLLGTYRYIKSVTKGDKAFVTTIPKYLKEYEDWYYQALADMKEAKDVKDLFKTTSDDTGIINVIL